jgi:succinate dehydrogenase/fumarate reductase flavoprotein subunit
MEVQSILDCAEMAGRASLYRTESRWGLYHHCLDHPETDNENWFCHVQLKKDSDGAMTCFKRPIQPYIVELADSEKDAYHRLRIAKSGS